MPTTGAQVSKPKLSAQKAFGDDEPVRKTAAAIVKEASERLKNRGITAPTPPPPAPEPAPTTPEPPAPVTAPITPPAPTPAPAAKIKVGEKEFTPEELAAEYEALRKRADAPPPVPEPAAPAAPQPEKVPTPEEIAQREKDWIAKTAQTLDIPWTEAEHDTLLAGGPEAVKMLTQLRQTDMARAILLARKQVAEGINPVLQNLFAALTPIAQQHQTLQRHTVEQAFIAEHTDFAPHVDLCRDIAEQLLQLYPDKVAAMSVPQFNAEIARQADVILTNQWRRFHKDGDWRSAAAPAPTATPAPAAAPAPAPTPVPAVRPPAATAPTGAPSGGRAETWQAKVARTLVD